MDSILLLTTFHFGAQYLLPKKTEKKQNTQFLVVHTMSNIYTVLLTYHSILHIITHNWNSLSKNGYTPFNKSKEIGTLLHIYHILCYPHTMHDVAHHLIIPILIYCDAKMKCTTVINVNNFFMCGFPGAIIYFSVILKRIPGIKFTKKNEIYVSYIVNMYLRCPGILLNVLFVLYSGKSFAHFLYAFLASYNAIYYTWQSKQRYHLLLQNIYSNKKARTCP
jgi:hypothetical protein